MLSGVKNSIFTFRELEYRIKQDYIFKAIIQLNEVPYSSILSLRTKKSRTAYILWYLCYVC